MARKFTILVVAILIFAGCAPQIQKPMQVCPGKKSLAESLDCLGSRSQNTEFFRANGRCLWRYYGEDKKPKKENFAVKLWVNPPAEIYLQGDVAFNARGIVLGSNEEEFWLAIKPEISSYWWGKWAEQGSSDKLLISPKVVLEAFGAASVSSETNWSLSNEGAFDVLTKREGDRIIKKIYIYNCDYRVRKIEYFGDDGKAAIVAELDEYKEVLKGVFVPARITIATGGQEMTEDLFEITLGSIKAVDITEKQRNAMFNPPERRRYEHIFRIIDGRMVEQP